MSLFELHAEPELDRPVFIVAVDGWIDAGNGAQLAVEAITASTDTTLVATFDVDALLDFRARRPTMHLVESINTGLTWPSIELHSLAAPNGTDVLLLVGAEPDHAWVTFTDTVVELTARFGCRMEVGLGAYPAATPHTRPVLLSSTASSADLAATVGSVGGNLDVPAGIEAVLERAFADRGVPAIGLWAQVPHYTATMQYPAAAIALIEALNRCTGTDFGAEALRTEQQQVHARIDALVHDNPQHVAMIRQLEAQFDEVAAERPTMPTIGENLPSGDDLAEELQRFLREQGD